MKLLYFWYKTYLIFFRWSQAPANAHNKKEKKVGILKPQGSLERSKATGKKDHHNHQTTSQKPTQILKDPEKKLILPSNSEKRTSICPASYGDPAKGEPSPTVIAKPKPTRTNVALQAILKRNSNNQETKQVSEFLAVSQTHILCS